MNKIRVYYHNYINKKNCSLFLLELTFLAAFLAFILPLINLGMDLTIHLWGQSYITFENVISYLSTPSTILFLLIMAILISLFLLYQLMTMIYYCSSEYSNEKSRLLHILYISYKELKRCLHFRNFALPYFTIFLFIFMNLPVLICITLNSKISFPSSADLSFVKVLLLLSYSLIAFIAFRGMFVVHFFIEERQSFLDAMELSKKLLKGRSAKSFINLLLYNLILTISCLFIYYVILIFVALFIFLTVENSMTLTVFLSVYPRINSILLILFQLASYIANLNIITRLYSSYRKETIESFSSYIIEGNSRLNQTNKTAVPSKKFRFHFRLHRHTVAVILLLVIVAGFINSYLYIQNDSYNLKSALSGIQVASHRGNSHVAPENTLPALENAIIAGSEYAEIDVHQTKDGALVLLHDNSLFRTTGLNRKIETIDLNELSGLDAGSWFSKDFIMTRIPTLREAMELCKGRIMLNIEVKANHKGLMFEENLVTLIKELGFEDQCVISSKDYKTLAAIKQLDNNLKTGLILSAAYGNYYNKESVDFFSIRSTHITRQVIVNAHKAGKEVHAWTVNSVSEIERMKSIGVDCIITDNPTLVKKILFQGDTSLNFFELLSRLLQNLSL